MFEHFDMMLSGSCLGKSAVPLFWVGIYCVESEGISLSKKALYIIWQILRHYLKYD